MAEYNPENPPITLFGAVSLEAGKDKYGISDDTGLGPNGSDKYISYDVVINNIQSQVVGDAGIRSSQGLGTGGTYTAQDLKVGDWVATLNGLKIAKITEITERTDSYISCSVEDVGMAIARQRSDRANNLGTGQGVVFFEVNDNNTPLFANDQLAGVNANNTIDAIQSYFSIYEPFQRFTFYPDETGSVEIGDLVTITGSVGGTTVTPYRLVPAAEGDTVIGVVSDIYGGNNVNVRPYNKIITNFSTPELLTDGIIGSSWYLSGSEGAYVTSSDFGDVKFFQLTDPTGISLTGSVDGPTFDETSYNLIINGVEVIPQDAGGSTLTLNQITASINESSSVTHVTADIYEDGGKAIVSTLDSAGSSTTGVPSPENGTLKYSTTSPYFFVPLAGTTGGGTGNYPSAPGKFAITASGVDFEVHPTTADIEVFNYPCASNTQVALDIESAASSAGADITVTATSTNSITITVNDGTDLIIQEISDAPLAAPVVGALSATGLPTGEFAAPAVEEYLSLTRTDGGVIFFQGNWYASQGLQSNQGTPHYLLMVEAAGSGAETFTNATGTPLDFPNSDNPTIPAGTTFDNTTFAEMMDLMLYPELNPTLTNPSNTFTISPSGYREIGEVISTITLSAAFNRGSINPAYGTDGFRSGLPNTYVYTGTGTSNNSSTSLTDTETVTSYTVVQGAQSWTGAVSYDEGDQPLTSKGNDYDSPLSAGTTSAITRTITGVYPTFATTSTISSVTKQSLQSMTSLIQVSMVAESGGSKQTLEVPTAWSNITGLQQFNTLNNTWTSIDLSSFTKTSISKTIQGTSISYYRYTHNGSSVGARQLRFTV